MTRRVSPCWLVSLLLATCSVVVTSSADNNGDDASSSRLRHVQSLKTEITDATTNYVRSSESVFDHAVDLQDDLSFHWNDIDGDHFNGRLIHIADSVQQAPSWLAVGLYHSNHNYTILPIANFMVGSEAIIGMTGTSDVKLYNLGGKESSQITPDGGVVDQFNSIVQHESDDGSVVTDLDFRIDATSAEGARLRTAGTNVFLWAVGPPGPAGVLSKHARKGVIYLDFQSVKDRIQQNTPQSDPAPDAGQNSQPTTTNPPTTLPTRAPVVNKSPVIAGNCNSSMLGEEAAQVALTATLTFHWKLISTTKVQMALEYTGGETWLGLASSSNGFMIGSTAIIGVPGSDEKAQPPTQYTLTDKIVAGLSMDDVSDSNVQGGEIVSEKINGSSTTKYRTVLTFTKTLNDPNDQVPIRKDGLNTLLYAAGSSRELAYHEHRGSFQLNLNECDGDVMVVDQDRWTNHRCFAAHGFFAILAWGLASPFAVAVAWFRTLVPTSWIYIHVFCNASTFLMTFLTFWIAVGGVARSDGADHFSKSHHFFGLILMILVTVQVLNGFLRPPVERKDRSAPTPVQDPDILFGCIPIPGTPRETWQLIHRSSGLTALALGIYQISSGLGLYADRFGTNSGVKYFFIYVALFLASLVGLKIYVSREEDEAIRGAVQAVDTSEPEGEDEEPEMIQRGTYS
jgi:hypothetical protein